MRIKTSLFVKNLLETKKNHKSKSFSHILTQIERRYRSITYFNDFATPSSHYFIKRLIA